MACICCGGVKQPKTLKGVDDKILFAEMEARRKSAFKKRREFRENYWPSENLYGNIILAFCGLGLLDMLAGTFSFFTPVQVLMHFCLIFLSVCCITLLGSFNEGRADAHFKKEYPEEAELLLDR